MKARKPTRPRSKPVRKPRPPRSPGELFGTVDAVSLEKFLIQAGHVALTVALDEQRTPAIRERARAVADAYGLVYRAFFRKPSRGLTADQAKMWAPGPHPPVQFERDLARLINGDDGAA